MKKVRRLYEQFQPKHYILDIVPNRDTMTFTGTVIVSGQKVGRPSKRLTLHQKDLKITGAHLIHHTKTGDTELKFHRTNHHGNYDEIRLHSEHLIYPGSYTIRLAFEGTITRAMNGMYPCFFTHNDTDKILIGTQFESHHAREVFPCIDEPEAKATFDLTLTTPAGEAVIANTPIKSQKTKENSLITSFERTPHMSTYLLAFVYGEMEYLEAKTKDGVVVRTYATPDNVKFTKFALDTAVAVLEFYNDYFDIAYPLDKCDMIALPDFASGAMENWGCITYREHAMLVDPDNTSLASKQYVALVVAHELAHQWFGNLVTMRWWTDLWLNEGFASWIEYLAVDHLYPNWKMWTQFVVDEQQQGLKLDSLDNTHPVQVAINHPDEIRTIFDAISYSKGSSVIHMLHEYLGADVFQAGLRYYLKKHAYKNTDTVDLWKALQEASEKPVPEFMEAWTSTGGYPLLSANITDQKIEIHQERFLLNSDHVNDTVDELWPIALLAHSAVLPETMTEKKLSITAKNSEKLKLNVGQSGFYRVSYNASHLQNLAEQVKRGRLEPLDRLGILSDAFETAKAGKNDAANALNLLDAYEDEDDNAVWDVIAANLASVRHVMNDEDIRESMKPFVRKLVAKQRKRLGWVAKPHESHFDRLLRPTILGMAALSDEPEVVEEALALFKSMHEPDDISIEMRTANIPMTLRGGGIDPDMRGVVYGTAARHGSQATFDKLVGMHHESQFSEERLNLCAAICGFKDPKLVSQALDLIQSDEIRLQDVGYWVVYSFSNRYARDATWQWMVKNWKWLEKNLGNDLSFYRFPIYASRAYSDASFLPEFSKFFESHMSPAFERNIKQAIETITWQSAWRERDHKVVKAFFRSSP